MYKDIICSKINYEILYNNSIDLPMNYGDFP